MENNYNEIYFDNAATTVCDKDAADAAIDVMKNVYGNPSSVHAKGLQALHILKNARAQIMSALGYEKNDGDVYFTSCGTEASNTALFSAFELYSRNKDNIVISDSEHPSVENVAKRLEQEGITVHRIPTKGGVLDLEYAKSVINKKTFCVSCMLVNNETGAVYDLKALKKIKDSQSPGAVFHVDAVQGFLKLDKTVSCIDADMVSVSAHKVHAPKGVGALFVRKGIRVSPVLYGGGQEKAVRSGTENLPGIAAFGVAAQKAFENRNEYMQKFAALNDSLRENLEKYCPDVLVNSGKNGFAKHIVSISVPGIRSEIMLRYLSERGIYVSAGSACSSSHADNRVLSAFGLDDRRADGTLRISFSRYNTAEETEILCKVLAEGQNTLVKTI